MITLSRLKLRFADLFRKTDSLQNYNSLTESQWLTYDEIVALQNKKLSLLVRHVGKEVGYFHEQFVNNSIDPEKVSSINDLSALSILTKENIIQAGDSIHARNKDKFGARKRGTGGSTGQTLSYYMAKKPHSAMWGNIWRGWNVSGYRPGDKVAVLAGSSLLSGYDLKRSVYYWAMGWVPFSSFDLTDEKMAGYLETLSSSSIKYIYGYASSVYELACFALRHENESIKLHGVITTAEMLLPQYRLVIEKAFGCKVINQYGANDGGVTAFECEHQNGLHIGAERCIVEIVDDNGNSLPDGEEGRIVLTDLDNYAQPFIRYEVGDIGTLDTSPCPCGRGLPRLMHIKGRVQDFVVNKNRHKTHGEFFSHVFRKGSLVKQFQVIQEEVGVIHVTVSLNDINRSNELESYMEIIKDKLSPMDVSHSIVDFFEVSKGGKHRFIVSNLKL